MENSPKVGDYVMADQTCTFDEEGQHPPAHGVITAIDAEKKTMEVLGPSGTSYTCIYPKGAEVVPDETVLKKRGEERMAFVRATRKEITDRTQSGQ